MLAAVILITWPTTNALRLVVLLAGALALLPWTAQRLRRAELRPWLLWSPLILGSCILIWSLISAFASGAPWALSVFGWYGRNDGILMLLGVVILLATGASLRPGEVRSAIWWVVMAASLAALVSVVQALGVGFMANPLAYQGANSLLGNPNFAAAFFAISALLSAGASISSESRRLRYLGAAATVLQLIAMLLATSQQGPLALVIGLAAGAAMMGLASRRAVIQRLTAGLAALVIALASTLVIVGLAGAGPIASLLRSDTLAIRLEYWKASLATMLGVPVFGTGPDGLARYIAEFRPKSYIDLLGPANRVDAAHNVALQFGATLGIVGLILWLALALSVTALLIWSAWTWSRRSESHRPWLLLIVGAAWAAYVAQAMVSIDMVVLLALGWTLAGFSVALARAPSLPESRKRPTGAKVRPGATPQQLSWPLVSLSLALAVLGAAVGLPAMVSERIPTISSLEEAEQALRSTMTPCPSRLTILNSLAPQVNLATYQVLTQVALESDSRCPPLAGLAADVSREAGDLETADNQSLMATRLDPLDYQIWLLRARILAARGDLMGARAAYDEAVRVAYPFAAASPEYLEQVASEVGAPPP